MKTNIGFKIFREYYSITETKIDWGFISFGSAEE